MHSGIKREEWGIVVPAQTDHVAVESVTVEEAHAYFDGEARRLLGISGPEFLVGVRKGVYKDRLCESGVARLLLLRPFGEASNSA